MGSLSGDETVTLKKAWINCMSLHTPGNIFASLVDSFSPTASAPDLATLESLFISPNTSTLYVLVLDEIDHLLTQDILPTLFELSLRPHSRLLLVGIANALDLTSRFLPRLKSRNLVPELLPFHPYNAPQINTVLTTRLRSLLPASHEDPTFIPFIHPAAVQLLSKKVAAASGDLRKAFDILRRAIELVELESLNALRQQQSALSETSIPNSPSRMTVKPEWSALTSPRATLLHVTKAASTSLGASVASRIAKLNAHQKAVLCVLAAKVGMGPMEVKKLRTEYSKACKEGDVGISPVGMGEFRDVVEGAEAVGVLEFVREKGSAGEKVRSRVGKMELLTALGGQAVNGREGWVKILGS
jgi:cell division control protein 6